MRELTLEEQELIAGGTDTTDLGEIVVTADPGDSGDWGGDWGDWGDSGDYIDGDGGGDSPPPEPEPYPECVEAAPAGASSGDVMNAARNAAAAIAAGNDEGQEYSSLIYSLNGVVSHTAPRTDGSPDYVNWTTADLPAGATILGLVHNHPDQSGIADGMPSDQDWAAYDTLQNTPLPNGITMDPNALHFIYTNEDSSTRVYDNTDKNQAAPSCAI